MIVYKYLHPYRIEVLENGAIRFTQPGALNDPFETMPCFSEYKEYRKETIEKQYGGVLPSVIISMLPSIIDEQIANTPKQVGEYFVMLSLTKKNNNALMWAHYSNSHEGFVIGFGSNSPFFEPRKGKGVDGLREVKYSTMRAVLPKGGLASLGGDELKNANEDFFFTKSDDWGYEEELRILAHPISG
jgi:hypothetical protein